ncbi:type II toxin-antitoxin system CcdA family antitoxin [Sphingomonas sp. PAMC 26621]|uniref:type II toxin-antitoxin system CcdA family antitoxin n=1 Tax=Sphingomonas sp. PAMC 26621 TaxID=1112213 RepID=UPI000289D5AE|nr:type II toxin-antitoxin system CcdA family antitoxin [Sphingomonas sp. PAMC 26621]
MARVREDRTAFRRPTNVTLDEQLVAAAKDLGINLSRACEQGLSDAVSAERIRRWQEDNREALEAANAYVAEYGLPLAKYRMF